MAVDKPRNHEGRWKPELVGEEPEGNEDPTVASELRVPTSEQIAAEKEKLDLEVKDPKLHVMVDGKPVEPGNATGEYVQIGWLWRLKAGSFEARHDWHFADRAIDVAAMLQDDRLIVRRIYRRAEADEIVVEARVAGGQWKRVPVEVANEWRNHSESQVEIREL